MWGFPHYNGFLFTTEIFQWVLKFFCGVWAKFLVPPLSSVMFALQSFSSWHLRSISEWVTISHSWVKADSIYDPPRCYTTYVSDGTMSDISPPESLLPAHLSKILKENKNQLAELYDAVLICEGQRFPVHRVVLAASSKYFKCLFSYSERLKGWKVYFTL